MPGAKFRDYHDFVKHYCGSNYDYYSKSESIVAALGNTLENGFVSQTGNAQIDQLLSRGGIMSMMPTVALIILTLSLGGLLMELGLISAVMEVVSQKMSSTPKLILSTLLTGIGVNIFIGEQFLSVIYQGMPLKKFTKRRLGSDGFRQNLGGWRDGY